MTLASVGAVTLIASVVLLGCDKRDSLRESTANALSLGEVIEQTLAANPGWHLGLNADCTNPQLKQQLVDNPSYQAYRAIGDFNADGQTDRVVGLVKGDSGKFYLALGRPGALDAPQRFDAPQLFAALNWIREGGLLARGTTVTFGMFDSDVAFTWQWSPSAQRLELLPDSTEH